MAAYGFLAAYALHGIHLQQLSEQERQLQTVTRRQQELVRQRHLLTQVNAFDQRVAALDLQRRQWLFYQVNVQGHFSYDAAQQIIEQCADSALAYYWPIALEIRSGRQESERRRPGAPGAVQGDVHLTVKGRFVAKKE